MPVAVLEQEARTTQTERDVLRARLARHNLVWQQQMLAGGLLESLVSGCVLALVRFCSRDALAHGGAGAKWACGWRRVVGEGQHTREHVRLR